MPVQLKQKYTTLYLTLGLAISLFAAVILITPKYTAAACDPAQVSESGVTNLITNSTFEVNTAGWSTIGGPTLAVSADQAHSGCQSLLVSNRTAHYEAPAIDLSSIGTTNKVYRVSVWARSSTQANMTLRGTLKLTDGNGTNYTLIDSVQISNSGWTKLIGYINYQTTGTVTESVIYFEQLDSETLETAFYIDEAIIEEVPAQSTYYINPTTGSDNNAGRSPSTAWQTTANLSSYPFRAGDQILFNRGSTFVVGNPIQFSAAGSSGSPITIGAYGTGANPTFENNDTGTINESIFLISGNYYSISNLTFTNTTVGDITESAIHIAGQNITVQNVEISNVGFGVKITGNNNTVANSHIHDLVMIVNTNNNGDDDYGSVGVSIENASNIVVENNLFEDIGAVSYDYGLDGAMVETFGSCTNITARYNLAINGESLVEMGSSTPTDTAQNIYLHHNVIVGFRSPIGAFHNNPSGGSFGLNISNVYIENNTFIKNTADNTGFVIGFDIAPTANQFFLRNNIFEIHNVLNWALEPGQLNHEYNTYNYSGITNFQITLDESEIVGANTFVNAASRNYRLAAGSPAINTGTNLGYTTDLYGTNLPQDGSYDIGAAEFTPVASSSSSSTFSTSSSSSSASSSSASSSSSVSVSSNSTSATNSNIGNAGSTESSTSSSETATSYSPSSFSYTFTTTTLTTSSQNNASVQGESGIAALLTNAWCWVGVIAGLGILAFLWRRRDQKDAF
jgi:hypothetical protein